MVLLASAGACDREPSRSTQPGAGSTMARIVARPPFNLSGRHLDTLASGLEVPWSLAFAPDGRIFVSERVGRIRVIDAQGLRSSAWATLPVFSEDASILPESGLMGIALAPDFASTGHLYVVGTFWKREPRGRRTLDRMYRRVAGVFSETAALPWENRIYRLTDSAGIGVDLKLIVGGLSTNYYHAGGALAFGPDGFLYLSNGEALLSARAGDRKELLGKILRYTPDGAIPQGNPDPQSPVYASGFRNVQGLAWEPRSAELFAVEHGPSFLPHEQGRFGHDELNVIRAGADYGWPVVVGQTTDGRFQGPVVDWTQAIAPAGLSFYTGPFLPWRNNAFVSGLRGQQLRRVALERDSTLSPPWKVIEQEVIVAQVLGRIRAVQMGPDGFLYFTTSNRDGRGTPAPGDDLLLRLRPTEAAARPVPARN
jgi:glucose/arabinose dehydrogenase